MKFSICKDNGTPLINIRTNTSPNDINILKAFLNNFTSISTNSTYTFVTNDLFSETSLTLVDIVWLKNVQARPINTKTVKLGSFDLNTTIEIKA